MEASMTNKVGAAGNCGLSLSLVVVGVSCFDPPHAHTHHTYYTVQSFNQEKRVSFRNKYSVLLLYV